MPDSELGLTAIYRLIKKGGAERIGPDAVEELRTVLEDIGLEIASQAVGMASHAGRRTVRNADVRLAAKAILRR